MIAREASCLCWAIESATNFRAAILSASLLRGPVVRGGISSSGLVGVRYSSCSCSSVLDVMVASEEGNNGGRV